MTDKLLNLINTQSDKTSVLNFLSLVSDTVFKIDADLKSIVEANKTFGPALLSILPPDFFELDPIFKNKMISKIKDQISAIPGIQIIVAQAPTETTIESLIAFAKEKTSEKSVLEIKIQPEILGGAIFIIDGKYIDLSVANKLNKVFGAESSVNSILNTK